MRNIEIKVRIDDREELERRLIKLEARLEGSFHQKDSFFAVARGWLKLREQSDRSELISYRRSTTSSEPRPSDYDIVPTNDPVGMHRLLARVLDEGGIVEKDRTLWIWRHTRIHLDRVEGLGDYLELETVIGEGDEFDAFAESEHVIAALRLDRSSFLSIPYLDLLRGTGDSPGNSTRPRDGNDIR